MYNYVALAPAEAAIDSSHTNTTAQRLTYNLHKTLASQPANQAII